MVHQFFLDDAITQYYMHIYYYSILFFSIKSLNKLLKLLNYIFSI